MIIFFLSFCPIFFSFTIAIVFVFDWLVPKVMGVPAHDERDFEFAKRYNLPIIQVVQPEDPNQENSTRKTELPYLDDGYLINSMDYSELETVEARNIIANELQEELVRLNRNVDNKIKEEEGS